MTAIPGTEPHPHARAVLGAALAPGGRPSHAYLLHGPPGSGKRSVARAFAAELLADGAADAGGARARALSGAHPDLTWVAPSGAHAMLVSDIAEPVIAAAAHTPFESRRRVFVIEQADTMGDDSANRLLKTLEEPPPFAHLILLTDRVGEVLPTIYSRCQLVRFEAPGADVLAQQLRDGGADSEQAAACARLALGDGARARRLASPEGAELRALAERFARAALGGDTAAERPWEDLLALARGRGEAAAAELDERLERELEVSARSQHRALRNAHAERARRARRRAESTTLALGLQLAALWYRDAACVAWDAPELVHHSDRAEAVAQDAAGRDPQRLRAAVELVEETGQRLELNVGEELATEALAYRLRRLLAA